MSTNRIAKYESLLTDEEASPAAPQRGFALNPFAASLTPAQLQMYQAAFLFAKQKLEEAAQDPSGEWNI